jgi:hypothetical protein
MTTMRRGSEPVSQEIEPLHSRFFLTRREDAIDAELRERLESCERVARHVEGAVEGNRHRPGALDELARASHIDVARRGQDPDDDAVGPEHFRGVDVAEHHLVLGSVVEKVSAAGANDDVEPDAEALPGEGDGAGARGQPALEKSAAKLDAGRPTFLGGDGALHRIDANFEDHGGSLARHDTNRELCIAGIC